MCSSSLGSHTPRFAYEKSNLRGKRLMSLRWNLCKPPFYSDSDVPRYLTSKFAPAPVKTHRVGLIQEQNCII
jgi:hypothetical protein